MRDRLGTVAIFGAIGVALVGFHFWGQSQRHREWWWVGGSPEGMLFLDLANTREGNGHLLMTFIEPEDGAMAHEFDVTWTCRDQSVSWGEVWTLDNAMRQIERYPSPRVLNEVHHARGASELLVLQIACARPPERARMRTLRVERPPIEVTGLAHRLMGESVPSFGALMLAAHDPRQDAMVYERLMTRYVPAERIARVRQLTGAME